MKWILIILPLVSGSYAMPLPSSMIQMATKDECLSSAKKIKDFIKEINEEKCKDYSEKDRNGTFTSCDFQNNIPSMYCTPGEVPEGQNSELIFKEKWILVTQPE